MFIHPWNEEAERIMKQLSLSGRAFTYNMNFSKDFGKKRIRKDLEQNGFLEMYHSRRKGKTCFVTPPDVTVIPRPSMKGINYHFKRFKLLE